MSVRTVVEVPRLGVTAERVVLLEWVAAVGSLVKSGDPLAVVETDKTEAEVHAPHDGRVVQHCVTVEEEVAVGAPLCVLETVEA